MILKILLFHAFMLCLVDVVAQQKEITETVSPVSNDEGAVEFPLNSSKEVLIQFRRD